MAHAQAEPADCPAGFGPPASFRETAPEQQINQLKALATACEHNAGYHAYRGMLLLMLGQQAQALEALEKALLLDPELPGAQLDYAQTLALAGQKMAARDLLHGVLQRPDFPVDLRTQLTQADITPGTPWRGHALLQVSRGHETNLANATSTREITLVLPNGPVTIALADTERPQSGVATKYHAQGQVALPLAGGHLQLHGSYLGRQAGSAASADLTQLETGAAWAMSAGPGALVGNVVVQQVSVSRQTLYRDTTLSLKYETTPQWGICYWSPELGTSRQSYYNLPVLDGRYDYARLGLDCLGGLHQSRLALTAGVDKPQDAARPGGARRRQELQLRHDHLWSETQLSFWARWSRTQDATPFSALLGNLKAQTRISSIGLGLWHPVNQRWSMGIDLESTTQQSNNSLNNIQNRSLYAGLRWAWR